MNIQNFFPVVIIALMFLSALVYAINKDIGRTLYWIAGAVINIAANFLIK